MTRLDEIRKRLEAATPGPWSLDWDTMRDPLWPHREGPRRLRIGAVRLEVIAPDTPMVNNLRLIAAAPADLAWCVERIATLEGALRDALRADDCGCRHANCDECMSDWNSRARAALEGDADAGR